MPDKNISARVGIDIGGTFTDIALEFGQRRLTAKLLTTLENPVDACMEGLSRVVRQACVKPEDIDLIVHGTTLATNALIERKGAVTSMITTEGFRDVIEIGTEGRPEQYDVNILKPEPLVPRRRRFTVTERLNRAGEILLPLALRQLEELLPQLDAAGTQSLAICFLHSYVNAVHEMRAREFFAARRPDWMISISSDISPEFREFERFSTTCTNAYVQPQVSKYLTEFDVRMKDAGVGCEIFMMLSSGGLTTVKTACEFPVRLIESGPAGGAIFACDVARRLKLERAISFDMGGTTAKICLIDDAAAQTSRRFEVARVYRFRKDSGIPLRIPVIDMVEIGAGGGSVAYIDEMGRLAVGPESAGSEPGPACYGRGGTRPTVTDANVAMGRIAPFGFAGGAMQLDAEGADASIASAVGAPMGIGIIAAAFGITEMVCENMASAARVHAIESGKNTDDRALIAFGGAAPLHVCQMADKLGIDRIVIPVNAGVGSAIGFLRAPISFEVVQTHYQHLDSFSADAANAALAAMQSQAHAHVMLGAEPNADLTARRIAFMRYHGQGHEIPVALPEGPLEEGAAERMQALFDAEYRRVFGRSISDIAAGEIVTLSVAVSTDPHPDLGPCASGRKEDIPASRREVFDSASQSEQMFAIVPRHGLGAVGPVSGPVIVTENETSIVVSSQFDARMLDSGDVELRRIPISIQTPDQDHNHERA